MQHCKSSFQWLVVYKTFIVVIKTKNLPRTTRFGLWLFYKQVFMRWPPAQEDHFWVVSGGSLIQIWLYLLLQTLWSRYYFLQYTTLTCDLTRFLNVYTGVCCAWFGNLFWLKTLKQNLFLYFFVHWDSFHLRLNRHCKGFQGVARKRKALLKSIY